MIYKQNEQKNDIVIQALKDRYFKLITGEKIGLTPKITSDIDRLEVAINEMISGKALI